MLIGDFSVFAVYSLSLLLVCVVWCFLNGFFKVGREHREERRKAYGPNFLSL